MSKSTVCESIQWVENTLRKDKTFKLPGKKVLTGTPQEISRIVAGVTESPVPRPKKAYYSGKKKRHTVKTQVTINRKNRQIADIRQEKESVHDFRLYKDSIGEGVDESILMPGVSGDRSAAPQQHDTEEIGQEPQTERTGKSI